MKRESIICAENGGPVPVLVLSGARGTSESAEVVVVADQEQFRLFGQMMWLSHGADARTLFPFCKIVCSSPSPLLDMCGRDLENGDYLALSVLEKMTSSVCDLCT